MWIIEAVNKDPNYIYKRSIWYIDPELWFIVFADKYDKYGKLWKTMEHYFSVYKNVNGDDVHFFSTTCTIDHQRKHATNAKTYNKMGYEIPNKLFTISNLKRKGR
jgi:hypothetical protein